MMALERTNWQQMILRRFKSLRENIDPMCLLDKLYEANFLEEGSAIIRKSDSRGIKSMQVMIAITKKIRNQSSFNAFKDIISREDTYCANLFKEQDHFTVLPHVQMKETVVNNNTAWLVKEKLSIVGGLTKLKNEKLLNIIDSFVEELIFDLNDIEECLSYIINGNERQTASVLLDKIIEYTPKGSFRCFIHGLEQHTKNKDMSRIRDTLFSHLVEDEIHKEQITSTTTSKETSQNILIQKIAEIAPFEVGKHDYTVDGIELGSIVLRLKCGKHLDGKEVNSDFFKEKGIIDALLPFLHDKEFQELCPGIAFVIIGCDIIVRTEETVEDRIVLPTLIQANKSFLMEEIETGTLVAAFKERNIYCFEKDGLDLNADRKTRASKFLEIVDSRKLTSLFMNILKKEGMDNIYERLTTYERICNTDIDPSVLEKCLYLNFRQLTRVLDVDDIEEVFLDRNILNQEVFDEINDTFRDKSVAVMLLKIISSGKMAMLTLVELLYLKRNAKLADVLIGLATMAKGRQEEQFIKEKAAGYCCKPNGTEFLLTIHLVDMKDIDLQNTDVIVQKNSLVPIGKQHCDDKHQNGRLPEEVQSFYDSQDIYQAGCVINLERKFVYCDDKVIYSGDCNVLQYALQTSDGVASWYDLQDGNSIIYIQSKKVNETDSDQAYIKSRHKSAVHSLVLGKGLFNM